MVVPFSGFIPTVSNWVMIKITAISTLSVLFSPSAIILMLLFTFALPYLLIRIVTTNAKTSIKTIDIFRKNKIIVSILFLLALAFNASYNQDNIAAKAIVLMKPYDNACTIIPKKMLDMHFSDAEIKDAMSQSDCNPDSLALTKWIWSMTPKKVKPPRFNYSHGQWGYREELDT